MAHAYTPGLKVTQSQVVRKRRILPLDGEVLVKIGQEVQPDEVVARTELPGDAVLENVASRLGLPPEEVPECMLKQEGEEVEKGEIIAQAKSFFGLFKSVARSSRSGTIETRGAFIQGIFGIGGETNGPLMMACDAPDQVLRKERINPEMAGKVIVGGKLVTANALREAMKKKVAGVVVGGFNDKDLIEFLGYDLGVAITGQEQLGITLIITEGFGEIQMALKTFDLLKSHEGMLASVNGATQIRAGVIRPELVIPKEEEEKGEQKLEIHGLEVGTPVRVIRAPYFGLLGVVSDLPSQPKALESGSKARVLSVDLNNGQKGVVVPRANVEIIEE